MHCQQKEQDTFSTTYAKDYVWHNSIPRHDLWVAFILEFSIKYGVPYQKLAHLFSRLSFGTKFFKIYQAVEAGQYIKKIGLYTSSFWTATKPSSPPELISWVHWDVVVFLWNPDLEFELCNSNSLRILSFWKVDTQKVFILIQGLPEATFSNSSFQVPTQENINLQNVVKIR